MNRTRMLRARPARQATLAALLCATLGAVMAQAQAPRPQPPPTRPPTPRLWEVAGGLGFTGGYDLGSATADLTRNTTAGTDRFTQFGSDSSVAGAGAFSGRIARYLSPRLAVEGGLRYARPVNRIALSGDSEGAPDTIAEQTLSQYLFEASVLWHFPRGAPGRSRNVPFVFGSAGYLRELHEAEQLIETGTAYQAGGGMKFWFGRAPRRFGVRAEAAMSFRDGGVDFEDKLRMVPVGGVSVMYLF